MEPIFKRLSQLIEDYFGDDLLFASVFGSRARNENKPNSDIDLLIVLKKTIVNPGKVKEFKRKFINFQLANDILPDYNYPGEIISVWKLLKAIKGYGFCVDRNVVEIDFIKSDDWTAFNEYRQWLSAMAGPNLLLVGDGQQYENLKKASFVTVLLLALLAEERSLFESWDFKEILLKGGKEYLGFCNTLYTNNYLDGEIAPAVNFLIDEHILTSKNDRFIINRPKALGLLTALSNCEDIEYRKNFLGVFAGDEELKPLYKSLNIGIDFVKSDEGTLNYRAEREVRDQFIEEIPIGGNKMDDVIEEFNKKILNGSIRQSSPNYLAFPDAGNSIAGLCADLLISFTNQNLIATTKSAPIATFAEIEIITWLRKLIGFPDSKNFPTSATDVGGEMVAGGTMANAIALLVARCRAFPTSRAMGINAEKIKPILIIAGPTMHHYSHIASFWWLGMGEENIVFINTLSDYRFDCEDLDRKLTEYNNGITTKVVAVICQAGDSRTMTVENFDKVASVTKRHGVWLHVDACHGGILIFSRKFRDKLKGLDQADSISMDPHKGLCVTYPSSVVLFREVDSLRAVAKSTDITIQKGSYDLGQITPFVGSKSFDSLKLWFLIKNLGLRGIEKLIDYRFSLAEQWHEIIEKSSLFITLNTVEINSVVFSISPEKIKRLFPDIILPDQETVGLLNKNIHDRVYKEGYLCIHSFDIIDVAVNNEKRRVLGIIFGNPNTDHNDFPEYIDYLKDVALLCIREILKT